MGVMIKRCKIVFCVLVFAFIYTGNATGQCSICTKTAGQLGEKKAQSLNSGIIYLMLTPFAVAGYVGYKWWKAEKQIDSSES